MRPDWTLVGRPQATAVVEIASEARDSLSVLSPYVSKSAVAQLLGSLSSHRNVIVRLVTGADPRAVVEGSCDLRALRMIADRGEQGSVFRLHRLHAKVYVADRSAALVTSANLTAGGLYDNYEYGILIRDPATVAGVIADVVSYLSIATPLSSSALAEMQSLVACTPVPPQPVLQQAADAVEEILLREHVTGRTEHEVFASTIVFVLRREGPLSTEALHPYIQQFHPELCDDTRDRIIDGRSFGKRWKHQVRSAQQHLKDKGVIELSGGLWQLTADDSSSSS